MWRCGEGGGPKPARGESSLRKFTLSGRSCDTGDAVKLGEATRGGARNNRTGDRGLLGMVLVVKNDAWPVVAPLDGLTFIFLRKKRLSGRVVGGRG